VKLVVIAGPTGVGKSELAERLAPAVEGEIVNYDSVQFYRGFDIGSAKPPRDLRASIPHHLFDVVEGDAEFNAADYARLARPLCEEIAARGKLPLLVGGTFFYLRALLAGLPEMPGRDETIRRRLRAIAAQPRGQQRLHRWLTKVDPESGSRIPPPDRHRVERALEVWITSGRPISSWKRPTEEPAAGIEALKIGLTVPRPQLNERLDARVEAMYRNGLVEETRDLLARFGRSARPLGTIGYAEAAAVVMGEMTLADAIAETRRRTRAYAKRQMTWLKSERNVHWLEATERDETFRAALRLIERFRSD
jgi:tRNA dimethylallyltransferase